MVAGGASGLVGAAVGEGLASTASFWIALPIAFYGSVAFVGFLSGLIGYDGEMTILFSSGWARGMTLARRTARSGMAGVPSVIRAPRLYEMALLDVIALKRTSEASIALLASATEALADDPRIEADALDLASHIEAAVPFPLGDVDAQALRHSVALGMAVALAEEDAYAPKKAATTAEAHNALVLAALDAKREVADSPLLLDFAVRLGYFVERVGHDALGSVLDQLRSDLDDTRRR